MASSSFGLISSPPNPQSKNDVFLGFGGEDISKSFIDALYTEFKKQNLQAFRNFAQSYMRKTAMQYSRTAITILGEYYASMAWCLEEHVQILGSHGIRKTVLPIFYDADPSDVQNQTGSSAEAFAIHEETYKDDQDKVRRWRAALIHAASLSGWDSRGRHESELIKEIVDDIMRKLHPMFLSTIPSSSILAKTPTPYSSSFSSQRWKYEVEWVSTAYESEIITKTTIESKFPAQPVQIVDDETLAFFIEQSLSLDKSSKMNITKPRVSSSRTRRKMNKLRLLVNYDGKWANYIYSGGKTKGIMVSDSITYEQLVRRLCCILGVDPSEYKIIIRTAYASNLPTQPVELINDDDLTFFIDKSLALDDGSKIPLCITRQRRFYRWHQFFSSFVRVFFIVLFAFAFWVYSQGSEP